MRWYAWVFASVECVRLVSTSYLGLTVKNRKQGPGDKDIKKKLKHKARNEDEYDLSRYKPLLTTVLEV